MHRSYNARMSDTLDTAVLAIVPSEMEATLIVDALHDLKITAEASGALTSTFRAEAPGGVRILVRREDLAKARAALDDFRKEQSEIDWSTVDVGDQED
jgi:hypothetical protein